MFLELHEWFLKGKAAENSALPSQNKIHFDFLTHPVGRHIMAIFQDDNVKIRQAQIVKEWLGWSMKNHFDTWIGTSDSRPWIHLWDVLKETLQSAWRSWPNMNVPHDGNGITAFIFIRSCINVWSRSCIDNARVKHSVKSTSAHPKEEFKVWTQRCQNDSSCSIPTILSQFEPDESWHCHWQTK